MPPIFKPERTRLVLDISPELRRKIEALQTSTDAGSMTEVIRRAIAVYEGVMDYRKIGGEVIFRAPNGVESRMMPI